MPTHICSTCGAGWPPAAMPQDACPICEDERQYVPPAGQSLMTLDRPCRTHKAVFHYEGELLGLGVAPSFDIGQRALLGRTPQGTFDAADGNGALLVGDILQVGADCKHVGLMRSYTNYLPRSAPRRCGPWRDPSMGSPTTPSTAPSGIA